jgi:hypothetical protein
MSPTSGIVSSGGWFVFSSQELSELAAYRAAVATDRGCLYCPVPAPGAWLDVDDCYPGDWPVTRLNTDDGRLFTSVMYPSSIYSGTYGGHWMLASNLFLLAALLPDGAQRLVHDRVTTIDDRWTALAEVKRIAPFTEHCPGVYSEPLANDPIARVWGDPTLRDGRAAGERLLDALATSVAACASADQTPPAVLLSGGVDSAALAWTAHQLGIAPIAYSIGTSWGNEHDEASELASHCGITHRRIELTVDDLEDAIAPSILQLGHAEPEAVDSVLNVVAALRSGAIAERTVLSGWGSDLLNAGLFTGPCSPVAMSQALLAGLRRTQHSSEFSSFAGGICGHRLCHPYWHRAVVETSLSIDPRCKYGPREKQHLREAMASRVPASVAWRRKLALHHGTGVEDGLSRHFGGAREKAATYREIFQSLVSRTAAEHLCDLHVALEPSVNLATGG